MFRGSASRPPGPAAERLLLIGVSVRALAASAMASPGLLRRFPRGCIALDYFGDADLRELGRGRPLRVIALPRDRGLPRSLVCLESEALRLPAGATIYAGGLENRPDLLRRLARRGPLLGNGAPQVEAVRDPARFFAFLAAHRIPHPPTDARALKAPEGRRLWKPIRSGGGGRVRFAVPGESRPRGFYLQMFLEGPVGSAVVLAGRSGASLLGVSRQLAGWRELGGRGFRYSGNVLSSPGRFPGAAATRTLARVARTIAGGFGLRGLCGIDFILHRGVPRIIEVNPRFTASMELCEERSGRNLIDLHLRACDGAPLPAGPFRAAPGSPRILAKGVLYAGEPILAPDPARLAELGCRDRPMRRERIAAGQPICTVVAAGRSARECERRLLERAAAARGRLLRPQTIVPARFQEHARSW